MQHGPGPASSKGRLRPSSLCLKSTSPPTKKSPKNAFVAQHVLKVFFLWQQKCLEILQPLTFLVVSKRKLHDISHRSGAVIDLHFRSRYAKHLSTSVKPSGSEWKSLDDTLIANDGNQQPWERFAGDVFFFSPVWFLVVVVVVVVVVVPFVFRFQRVLCSPVSDQEWILPHFASAVTAQVRTT